MIRWTLTFLIIAMVAAVIGFGGVVVGAAVDIAKMQFFFFMVLFVISLIGGTFLSRRNKKRTLH